MSSYNQPQIVKESEVSLPSKPSTTRGQSKSLDIDPENAESVLHSPSRQFRSALSHAFGREKSHSDDKKLGIPHSKRVTFMERLCHFAEELASSPLKVREEVKEDFQYLVKLGKGIHKYVQDETDGYPDRATLLEECELEILKEADNNLKLKFHKLPVDVNPDGSNVIIHSVCYESISDENPNKFPLVLIHGYAGGLACFYKNFSSLCKTRRVYAIDLPGFASSSRVEFNDKEPEACRAKIVDLIEKWRSKMEKEDTSLSKFIILGHSFGGYIAASYALKYKEYVRHLILVDPWGVLSKEEEEEEHVKMRSGGKNVAVSGLAIANSLLKEPILSLQGIRDLGEMGSFVFVFLLPTAYGPKMIPYIYLANKEEPATGEDAFNKVSNKYIWPQVSLKDSLIKLAPSVPISLLYGNKSPYHHGGSVVKYESEKNVHLDKELEAGHHPQVEDPETFNMKVNEICDKVDANEDTE